MAQQTRLLDESDASDLLRLRQQALLDAPYAFLASPDDDLALSEAAVRELLRRGPDSVVFGAWWPHLIGMLGLYRARQMKAAHKANLWGMFVLPVGRRQGVAGLLLEAAIRHAHGMDGIASLHLCVSETALAARHLYERAGFRTWGIEPDAIRFAGRSGADHHMSLSLRM